MTSALGAPGSLLDALQSLASSKSSPAKAPASSSQGAPDAFASGAGSAHQAGNGPSAGSRAFAISPQTMSALIDAQSASADAAPASPSDALQKLFSQLDADGNGSITKSEVENVVSPSTDLAEADSVFGELDADGDGAVSRDELKGYSDHHLHGVLTNMSDGSKGDGSAVSSTNPLEPGKLKILDNVQFTVLPMDLTAFVNSAVYHLRLEPSAIVSPDPVNLHPDRLP